MPLIHRGVDRFEIILLRIRPCDDLEVISSTPLHNRGSKLSEKLYKGWNNVGFGRVKEPSCISASLCRNSTFRHIVDCYINQQSSTYNNEKEARIWQINEFGSGLACFFFSANVRLLRRMHIDFHMMKYHL